MECRFASCRFGREGDAMTAAALLDRVDRVRQTGPGRWLACCPAHEDRTPSLSVRELDDGRTLVHCFSGCGVDDVCAAVGLTVADLFPPSPTGYMSPRAPRIPAGDILAALAHEATYVAITARDIINGDTLTEPDVQRLWLASGRLLEAVRIAGNV